MANSKIYLVISERGTIHGCFTNRKGAQKYIGNNISISIYEHELNDWCSDGEKPDASENTLPIDIVKPRFSEITKETGSGFAWLFKAENHACEANDNSVMIRTLAEKYNEIVKFLNGA